MSGSERPRVRYPAGSPAMLEYERYVEAMGHEPPPVATGPLAWQWAYTGAREQKARLKVWTEQQDAINRRAVKST